MYCISLGQLHRQRHQADGLADWWLSQCIYLLLLCQANEDVDILDCAMRSHAPSLDHNSVYLFSFSRCSGVFFLCCSVVFWDCEVSGTTFCSLSTPQNEILIVKCTNHTYTFSWNHLPWLGLWVLGWLKYHITFHSYHRRDRTHHMASWPQTTAVFTTGPRMYNQSTVYETQTWVQFPLQKRNQNYSMCCCVGSAGLLTLFFINGDWKLRTHWV